ncbi:unnamed protein product [Camellia sinensis]
MFGQAYFNGDSPSPVEDPISGDDVISRSIQNVSDTVSRHRPWSDFLAAGVFDSPESLSAASLRLHKHSKYFSITYAILILICAAFSILLTPISLIAYAAVFALSNGSHRSSLQRHVSESSASIGNPSPSAILQEPSRRRFGSTVQHLLTIDKIDVNAKNINGYTALDILAQSRRGVQDWDIQNSLKQAGALKAADNQGEWLAKKMDALMVVASLLTTIAFQAGVSPPGGVWQNDSPEGSLDPHRTGEAVAAYTYPESYQFYLRANMISFVASLSTILLLISGLPLKRKNFMRILMMIMCLSITSIAFSYAFSLVAVTPKTHRVTLHRTLYVAVPVWCVVMVILLLVHTIQLTLRWLKDKNWKSAVENCQIKLGVKDANSNRDVQMT